MKNKTSLPRNPVAKHMHKSCTSSVVPQKRRSLQSEATLREMSEVSSEGQFDSETMCFAGDCNEHLNDIGCSNISVNTFEDNYEGEK